ncbi:MAG: hypothetical protein AAGA88_06310 [Pseudomonadota bacterium]
MLVRSGVLSVYAKQKDGACGYLDDEPAFGLSFGPVKVLGVEVRPLDWIIAALAAAFIAAGVVVVVPLGSNDDTASALTPPRALDTVTPRNETSETVAEETVQPADPFPITLLPQDEAPVRKVSTETINVNVEAFVPETDVTLRDGVGGPAIFEVEETSEQTVGPLQLASFGVNDTRIPVGCGLILTEENDQTRNLFYHSLPAADGKSEGYLIVNNRPVAMTRTAVSGQPVGFGQYPVQTFESIDKTLSAIVELSFRPADALAASLQVETGRLIVSHSDGRTVTRGISGDAGC